MNPIIKASGIISACVLFEFLSAFAAVKSEITDADWLPQNRLAGTNGKVLAAVSSKGKVYFGGKFSAAGTVLCKNIVQWDGKEFFTVGTGADSTVMALAVDRNGVIYAGGAFIHAGGKTVNHIAKWDGNEWSPLGTGTDSAVTGLALDSAGILYACGRFITAGGIVVNKIAAWDGSKWQALGLGVNDSTYKNSYATPLQAVACDPQGNLYICGNFTTVGGVQANNIARWDGTTWSPLGRGITYFVYVYALAFDRNGNLFAGGVIDSAGDVMVDNIAQWNGTAWSSLMDTRQRVPTVYAIRCDTMGNVFAGGEPDNGKALLKWDGARWDTLSGGVSKFFEQASVNALAFDEKGILYAGGEFNSAGLVAVQRIANWDGSQWSSLGQGILGSVTHIAFSPNHTMYVGGSFGVARRNGDAWDILFTRSIYALACDSSGNVYQAKKSSWANSVNGPWYVDIMRLDKDTFEVCAYATNGWVKNLFFDKSGTGTLYAAGDFTGISGCPDSTLGIAGLNGNSWSPLKKGIKSFSSAVAFSSSLDFYAAGGLTITDGDPSSNIGKWNGNGWSALGKGVNGSVASLAQDKKGNVYAAGFFDSAGGVPARYIAKWDGTMWGPIASHIDSTVLSVACDNDGNLYLGGNFHVIDGITVNGVAKWDGKAWSGLGSGVMGDVYTLEVWGDTLFVGGSFLGAGAMVSPGIAKVCLHGATNDIDKLSNPKKTPYMTFYMRGTALIFFGISSHDTIRIFGLSGRCMRQARGVNKINLSGITPQPLFVRVSRAGKVVSTGMVMVQ